jgi:D-alanyl-D-alanine carboxypeptidase (penicillin-binding protein 5/6)
MDVSSGRILYAHNAHERRPPASLTKVITALLALETEGFDETVTVSSGAARVEGSSIWLEAGETLTLGELLYGLMLRSGNDAAEAIAEHVAGGVDDFVLRMNRRAEALGALSTHFRNPHGLPAAGHLTTAADLALIARAALERDDFREIIATRQQVIPWPGKEWDRALLNENRLLWLYPGADGVKTGWTREAGRCLIASATRDGWQLVAVVLNAPSMWTDATRLLDWGFATFRPTLLFEDGDPVARVRVAGAAERWVPLAVGREVRVALLPGEEDRLAALPEVPPSVRSPLGRGQEIGSLRVTVDGVPLAPVPLVAVEEVPPGGVVGRFVQDLWCLLLSTLERLLGRPSG